MNRVWIETFKLVWWEEDASLMAFNLCKEILLLVIMRWRHIACGDRLTENVTQGWQNNFELIFFLLPEPHPPCQWAGGWMSAVPSFSWLAACWSSSSWNQESQQRSSFLLCRSASAADIPLKCTRKGHMQNVWAWDKSGIKYTGIIVYNDNLFTSSCFSWLHLLYTTKRNLAFKEVASLNPNR